MRSCTALWSVLAAPPHCDGTWSSSNSLCALLYNANPAEPSTLHVHTVLNWLDCVQEYTAQPCVSSPSSLLRLVCSLPAICAECLEWSRSNGGRAVLWRRKLKTHAAHLSRTYERFHFIIFTLKHLHSAYWICCGARSEGHGAAAILLSVLKISSCPGHEVCVRSCVYLETK